MRPHDHFDAQPHEHEPIVPRFAPIHELPPIFHYYSQKHVAPELRRLGYNSVEDFFVKNISARARQLSQVRVVSYGSGSCEFEQGVVSSLRDVGFANVHVTCVDMDHGMLDRGRRRVLDAGMGKQFSFIQGDVTVLASTLGAFDVHMAVQSLHHVDALEALFSSVARSMDPSAMFLISDVIGRNGHMRWPETLVVVERLWSFLQPRHRFNRLLNRYDEGYVNHDCSTLGFEGIRAEDILSLLMREFAFEEFVGFGGICEVFTDRPFGSNFDVGNPEDLAFIDYVHSIESRLLKSGEIKPTQVIAKLRRKGSISREHDVSHALRRGDPARLPDVDALDWRFSDLEIVLRHAVGADPRFLGSGFYDFDPTAQTRWTGRRFSLKFTLPGGPEARRCYVQISAIVPAGPANAGCNVFANGVRVARLERIFSQTGNLDGRDVGVTFDTLGGSQEVTFILDELATVPKGEQRELGLILRCFTVSIARVST